MIINVYPTPSHTLFFPQPMQKKMTLSSYQTLLEGHCEVLVKTEDQEFTLNISELLRDLYQKHYAMAKKLDKLTAPKPSKIPQPAKAIVPA